MRVLIAPSAYKGTFSCVELADAMGSGVKSVWPDADLDILPIADGGDGTIDALYRSIGGKVHRTSAEGPNGQLVVAPWLEFGELAIVEMAAASGIGLLRGVLDPVNSHSKGTGQVMRSCIERGLKNMVVCVGGSASTDGGAGLLTALGAKFWKRNGEAIALGAGELNLIAGCNLRDAQELVRNCSIAVAVDVANPLLGNQGAAAIYGPQKGADPATVMRLDESLQRFADVLEMATSRQFRNMPGTGAAGGTAFGVACGLGAEIISGFEWMSTLFGLEDRVQSADIIFTGEGQLDDQSFYGKASGRLSAVCKKFRKPLIAIPAVADIGGNLERLGLTKVVCASRDGAIATLADVSEAVQISLSGF
ncbi:MAG TPA: glycerate kinase [Oculatellaceae cyanobacterium]